MSEATLHGHRHQWQRKAVLREIYADYYRRILASVKPGPSLEIGGGSGNLKEFSTEVISTDLIPAPWLDAAADAQLLPFSEQSFCNVVGVDVLHHIERPCRFLSEAARVLRPGGRLILVEPAITPLSGIFYRFFHPEPVAMSVDPLIDGPRQGNRDPFDGNQAIPTLLFGKYRNRLNYLFPALDIVRHDYLSLFAYPLSGGFRPWSLIPASWVSPLLKIEDKITPFVGRLSAFRLLVVLEKHLD